MAVATASTFHYATKLICISDRANLGCTVLACPRKGEA